jgi:hypothetical protein
MCYILRERERGGNRRKIKRVKGEDLLKKCSIHI